MHERCDLPACRICDALNKQEARDLAIYGPCPMCGEPRRPHCDDQHVYLLTEDEFDAIWQHVPEYYRANLGNPPVAS